MLNWAEKIEIKAHVLYIVEPWVASEKLIFQN